MSTTKQERLRKVFDYLVFSGHFSTQGDFANIIGANKTNLSSAMNGNEKYLSDSLFGKIANTFPELNLQWLLCGEGDMLKVPATLTVFSPTAEERRDMSEGVDMSVVPAEVVEEIRKEIKEEDAVPIVPTEIAAKAEADIRKYVNDNAAELEMFDPRTMTVTVDVAERVHTTSMLPTFVPGDIVFIRFLKDKTKIIDGRTYYFDTKTRPTMIRIVKLLPEGGLRLIAQNPRYGDIYTTFDDILNIAEIKGLYREQFGDQFAEIEQVRRHKDAQVDSLMKQSTDLIEQNGKALQIIKDLINK